MKLTLQLGFLSTASIAVSFLFQWQVLTILGPGTESDALFAGMTIPQLVLAVISGSLMNVLVPLLSGLDEDRLRHDAWSFVLLIGGLFAMLAALLYFTADMWIPLTVPGFGSAEQTLTVRLSRIQLMGMVFSAIHGVQWAAYRARHQFLWAETAPLLLNIAAVLALSWALPRLGVEAAAWLVTLRLGVQTLLLAPALGRPVLPNLRSAAIQTAWHRIKPLLLGTAYYKTDPLIDRFLLSSGQSGSLSVYYLAQQIYGAFSQVVNKVVAGPLVPLLSKLYVAGNVGAYWLQYRRLMLRVGSFSLAVILTLGVIGFAGLDYFVEYTGFPREKAQLLWLVLMLLAGQLLIGNMGAVMTSMFYARGDTRAPTVSGAVAYTLGIPIKVVLFQYFGVGGLAVGVSLYYIVSYALMSAQIKKIKHADTEKNCSGRDSAHVASTPADASNSESQPSFFGLRDR